MSFRILFVSLLITSSFGQVALPRSVPIITSSTSIESAPTPIYNSTDQDDQDRNSFNKNNIKPLKPVPIIPPPQEITPTVNDTIDLSLLRSVDAAQIQTTTEPIPIPTNLGGLEQPARLQTEREGVELGQDVGANIGASGTVQQLENGQLPTARGNASPTRQDVNRNSEEIPRGPGNYGTKQDNSTKSNSILIYLQIFAVVGVFVMAATVVFYDQAKRMIKNPKPVTHLDQV